MTTAAKQNVHIEFLRLPHMPPKSESECSYFIDRVLCSFSENSSVLLVEGQALHLWDSEKELHKQLNNQAGFIMHYSHRLSWIVNC